MGQNLWGETRRGGGDQSVENSQFMGWTTTTESTQKLGEKGIDLTRVKGQTNVSKEVVDNMFRFQTLDWLELVVLNQELQLEF